jgi:hypothetical protein
MVGLIEVATKLSPPVPLDALNLNPYDPEWDDDMTYPSITHGKFVY